MQEKNNVEETIIISSPSPQSSIQSKVSKQQKPKHKIEICKVLWSKPNSYAISIKGMGITIPTDYQISESEIEVKYIGTIGKSDFKIL
jgi:hypothetical protein